MSNRGPLNTRGSNGSRHLCVLLWLSFAALTAHAELKPDTKAAYQKYIAALDKQMAAQDRSQSGFLWIDGDANRLQASRRGEIVTQKVQSVSVPGGMVQHWTGGLFLPGATLAGVVKADQDYTDYGKIYAPDISRVLVLAHNENHFAVSYRITKTKVLTAVLDTVHSIDFLPLATDRMAIRSHSQSVRQVDDAGKASERVLSEGEGSGFLWAMDSYWRMEQRDGGVYVECQAVTLSRDVPLGMGVLIDPILQSFAEESLKKTLDAKRRAVTAGG
jgi:hypothetical protein